jgi:hypothetical protein
MGSCRVACTFKSVFFSRSRRPQGVIALWVALDGLDDSKSRPFLRELNAVEFGGPVLGARVLFQGAIEFFNQLIAH